MSENTTGTQTKYPRIIRHDKSGVWIGYVLGRGELDPDNQFAFEGRRIWSWNGGRLECSQLATQGVRLEDKLGDWVNVDIDVQGRIECIKTTEELVEHARSLPKTEV